MEKQFRFHESDSDLSSNLADRLRGFLKKFTGIFFQIQETPKKLGENFRGNF
ncbi:hypothetical protein LEP1GSC060_1912 [Leptospira weilii serovar Ranarum str. ICFT]|uniref:Uncharacterized protein n=1 Tax=Leptospira weilii serovar Ranarum str. ICFT TaxID=1218598 RepID=N1WAV5_9LEPT|nr:hypothetical protein LEP1GSC060_1912 [Leptospira weilii serovar Ranarum str. ICFT]